MIEYSIIIYTTISCDRAEDTYVGRPLNRPTNGQISKCEGLGPKKKHKISETDRIVLLRYGKNAPPALVLLLLTTEISISVSWAINATTSASLIPTATTSSPTTTLISISPFTNKLIVLSFKGWYLFDVNNFYKKLYNLT